MKPAGMCCTMTIGGVSAGMRVSSASIACGPPVEAPIAMMPFRRRAESNFTGRRRINVVAGAAARARPAAPRPESPHDVA